MEIKDLEELVSNLTAIDVSLRLNIEKIEKFDVENQLKKIEVEKIGKNITKKLENEVEKSVEIFVQKNEELKKVTDKFEHATANIMQIDDIAEKLEDIINDNKKINRKIKFIPIFSVAFLVGILSFFASNINQYFSHTIKNENQFIERFPDTKFFINEKNRNIIYLSVPENTKVTSQKVDNQLFIGFEK